MLPGGQGYAASAELRGICHGSCPSGHPFAVYVLIHEVVYGGSI